MLRQFAGLLLVFLAIVALAIGAESARDWAIPLGLGALLGVAGLIWPPAIRWLFVGWMIVAFPVGWTISQLLLAILLYLLFTPMAVLMRLKGRDRLHLRRRSEGSTYWTPKETASKPQRYFRQF
jgi:hypothetical protein